MLRDKLNQHIPHKESNLLYYGSLAYIIIFYSQIAARIPVLDPFRVEFVIGSVLVVFALLRIIRGVVNFYENKLNRAALFFLLAAFATIPFAFVKSRALDTSIVLLKFFAIYLMIITTINSEKMLKIFLFVYFGLILLLFLEPFILSLQGKGFIYNNHMMRLAGVTGYFKHPNQLAGICSANLPFFYYLMKWQRSKIGKIACLILIAISIRVIMLTQSRTGFIGVMAFGFLVWIFSSKKILSLIAIILSCAILWHFAPQETKDRFLTLSDSGKVISGQYTENETGSMGNRWTLIKRGLIVFSENPFIGVGLNCFSAVQGKRWNYWFPPHNTYIQALAEMGMVGFIAFLYVIVISLKNLNEAKNIMEWHNEKESFLYYMVCAVTWYLILRLIVTNFGQELYANYWWLSGGLSLVILRIAKQKYSL